MRNMDISALVLAGGKSSRMGTDKSLLTINGRSLIEQIVESLRPFVAEVIVSTNEKEKYCFLKDVRFVEDFRKGEGPLIGLISGLELADTPWVFAVSCDAPLVTGEFLQFLADFRAKDILAVAPYGDGYFEPLLSLYKKEALPFALSYLERYNKKAGGMLDYLDSFGLVRVVEKDLFIERFGSAVFLNVNDKDSYERLKEECDVG